MNHLYFGPRARRRARRHAAIKRFVIYSWLVLFVMAGLGYSVPKPGVAFDLLGRAVNGERLVTAASSGVETTETAQSTLRFQRKLFESRPTPNPSESAATTTVAGPAAPVPAGSITDIIYRAAAEFGVSGDWMVSIAVCESTLNPGAYNAAGYYGLFQYDQTTWAGYGYGSIYDPVAQSRTTARLLAAGQSSRWPNCA